MILDKLNDKVKEGFLRKVEDGDLVSYNYTDKCMYEKAWDEVTLKARGTVYHKETGKVVAKAFPKFFNFGELDSKKQSELLSETDFTVSEKADGSLGIIYYYDGEWRVNTRGSFSSNQAVKAKEMLSKYPIDKVIARDQTLLCEIIYPANKIIVNYGDKEELVMLGAYENKTGEEYPIHCLAVAARAMGMRRVKSYKIKNINELITLQSTIPKDEEGFVVKFANGERVKFKGAEYCKIARVLSKCVPLELWRNMKEGVVCKDFLVQIPEEFLPEIQPIVDCLEDKYHSIMGDFLVEHTKVMFEVFDKENIRKAIGLKIKELKYGTMHFAYLDNKIEKLDNMIMKEIRPTGNAL